MTANVGRTGALPERVMVAAGRAGRRSQRWFGWLNTCLTRSLVAGTLLAGDHDVVLHVGFRPGEPGSDVDGHAWLEVDGEVVDLRTDDSEASGEFESALALSMNTEREETR